MRSPITNEPVLYGALCLGSNKEHQRATDAAIFQFICGGKKLGNADLWFAVICLALEEADLSHLSEQTQYLQKQLLFRLKHSRSFASLSGLATSVTTKMPLGAAVWFCSGGALAQRAIMPRREAFRIHSRYLHVLKELNRRQGFQISPQTEEYLARMQVMLQLLSMCKQDGWKQLKLKIRGLVQNSMECLGETILLDGSPSEERVLELQQQIPKRIQTIPTLELVHLAECVNQ